MSRSKKLIQFDSGQRDRHTGPSLPHRHGAAGLARLATAKYWRTGRVAITVLLVIVALTAGAAGGYWLPGMAARRGFTSVATANSGGSASADKGQWYTCGMHPNVLQQTPGLCPICQMKLTPLKTDGEGSGPSSASKERKVLYWRAPMDPGFISEKPGKSPMGMDMVPVYADQGDSPSSQTIRIDPVTIQNMGIRTAVIKRAPLVKTIRTVGRLDYDEQLVTFVDTKFNGWIEKLDVDETGQRVTKGDPLFDVYSPELYAAQEEYLAAIRTLPMLEKSDFPPAREQAVALVEAATTKLKYLDVSDAQIEALRTTGKVEKTMTIYAPSQGIVTEKMALEGMYVKPGMRLYTIADLSRVWVFVDVYEYQLPWIRVGQTAKMTLSYIPGKEFVGKVVYIYPYLEKKTRVIKVRLEFENPGIELKPGMFANVRLEAALKKDAILVPREAYIDSGTRQVAFVNLGGGKFAPRDIQVGVEAESGMVEVLYGLDEGEVVVTSGQFMLDAESKLKEAVAKMMEIKATKTTKRLAKMDMKTSQAHKHKGEDAHSSHGGEHATSMPMSMPSDAKFACPMEKHLDEVDPANQGPYFSAKPGKCPRCGMKLKPLDKLSWMKKHKHDAMPATPVTKAGNSAIPEDTKFACPMEKHSDEADPANQGPYFSAKPGKCPRCGMKLKPLGELEWAQAQLAAKGGDVAYTCPTHQHIFSDQPGQCPRCGEKLTPFKVMYTCPDPAHAGVIFTSNGNCPLDGQGLAAFRGVWLDPSMAEANVPADPGQAEVAPWRCPVHPLVHSHQPGRCTICGIALESTKNATSQPASQPAFPRIQPDAAFVCPMHPMKIKSPQPGVCSICGMQLVPKAALKLPEHAAGRVAVQMNHIMEHYLELQKRLASDSTANVALHALGLASASEQLIKHLKNPSSEFPPEVTAAAEKLHAAALKTTGTDIAEDRVAFAEISSAVQLLVEHIRPSAQRWPKLYIYHCPTSNANWLQAAENKANPYYGFKMLKCGDLKSVK